MGAWRLTQHNFRDCSEENDLICHMNSSIQQGKNGAVFCIQTLQLLINLVFYCLLVQGHNMNKNRLFHDGS